MKGVEEISFQQFVKRAEFFRKFYWWNDIENQFKPDKVYIIDGEQLTIQLEEGQHLIYIADNFSATTSTSGGPIDLSDCLDTDQPLATGKTVFQKGILLVITANFHFDGKKYQRSNIRLYVLERSLTTTDFLEMFEDDDDF